jgi:hypothetical protein
VKKRDDLDAVPNRNGVYGWGAIADGSIWEMGPDDLLGRTPKQAMLAARNWAGYHHMRINASETKDTLIIQFIPKNGDRP